MYLVVQGKRYGRIGANIENETFHEDGKSSILFYKEMLNDGTFMQGS